MTLRQFAVGRRLRPANGALRIAASNPSAPRVSVRRRSLSRVILLLLLAASALAAERGPVQEYDVKAVFLHHFTRYVRWPTLPGDDTFEIVVFGPSPILAPLTAIAARKSVDTRRIVVRSVSAVSDIGRPQILFVSSAAKTPLAQILAAVHRLPVLTVAEQAGAAASGATIGFVQRGSSIKFEVNERVLRETQLSPGAKLLEIGIRIDDPKEPS